MVTGNENPINSHFSGRVTFLTRVAVIGLVGKSVFLPVDHFHTGGETIEALSLSEQPGGKGFNQAIAAARFGAQVSLCAAVGNDGYAAEVAAYLKRDGVTPFLCEKNDRSAYAVILTDKNGTNHVTEYTGPSLEISDIVGFQREIEAAGYLILTNETPLEVNLAAAHIAADSNTVIICNPAPYHPIPHELKELVTVFTPNEHETLGLEDFQNCIITQGEKGCYDRLTVTHYDAEKVTAIDTTGAGDTFTGVFTAMLAKGFPRDKAISTAVRASGISVTRAGAVSSIPYIHELP